MTACAACSFDPDATVLARFEFTVPRDLGTLNARVFNGRQGWSYRKLRDAWFSDLSALRRLHAVRYAGTKFDPKNNKRRVTLTRLYTGRMREMDLANIDAKACVDAMKLAGLIFDDAPRYYEGHVKQERGSERGTRVVIEELGNVL